ncbi:MAG: hypothetical protein KF799_01105 [Bdellovibrionales bacterium]|nr:hypothetical protein [Bdellovibrionales bacterium]
MKSLFVSLVAFVSFSASAIPFHEFDLSLVNDPASDFILQTLNRGKQIMELKSDEERLRQMCALVKARAGKAEIGVVWLGEYSKLARERAAVNQFYNIIPNILMTKAVKGIGGGEVSGSYVVNPKSTARGGNLFATRVTITDAKGKSYNGTVVSYNGPNGWKIVDGEYMGFSAVRYSAREYQDFLRTEYNKDRNNSLPVTALIRHITSEAGYIDCN